MHVDMKEPCADLAGMDDDLFSSRPEHPLALLAREDLDPLSQDELEARITALEAEIGRVRTHLEAVSRHRSAADALFKR